MRKLLSAAFFFASVGWASAQPANATIQGCTYFVTPPVLTDTQYGLVGCDSSGALRMGITGATTTQAGGTVAVTNTFQTVLAASASRKSCTLQNNDTNVMYVFFGTLGSATLTNSFKLAAGSAISCLVGNIVLTDAINVTGTATGAYVISSQ
jgi:hypothetical protein